MLGLHRLLRRWHVRKGRLVVLPSVPSPELDNRRDHSIRVPAAPDRGASRYPVIYMQDGQNLFDPALSFAGTWGVDEALSWASRRGLDAIVVGIPNMGDARIAEYDPFMGTGDRYLDRSEEHTSELQSRLHLVCRLLLEKKKIRGVAEANAQRPIHRRRWPHRFHRRVHKHRGARPQSRPLARRSRPPALPRRPPSRQPPC